MTERLLRILINSFGTILLPGLTVTIPLTILSFGFALVIAVTVALVQFAHVPVLEKLEVFRCNFLHIAPPFIYKCRILLLFFRFS